MTERDRVRVKKEIPEAIKLLQILRLLFDEDNLDNLINETMLKVEAIKLTHYNLDYFLPLPKIRHKNITIDGLSEHTADSEFGFSKGEIKRMRNGLRMPAIFIRNGCKFTADEILLCGLYRIHTPNFVDKQQWVLIFGWLQSRASLAFKLFWTFMMQNWVYLITDNLNFWLPFFPTFAAVIENKVNFLRPNTIQAGTNNIYFL